MKIYDMHLHAENTVPDPETLLSKMKEAGVSGGCVFSNWPVENNAEIGTGFDERMEEVLKWCEGYEGILFPVMWIHPYEENIIENIRKAVKRGIVAFKMICSDYYVYEDKCIEVIKEIASLDKPIFFHSGILWDGQVSSKYNRPVNWEALVNIKGLRFSMAHCSWPWIEECVALYGKIQNSNKEEGGAEMYFDTTPGTPPVCRKELLTKLYATGYDVGANIMFGSDCYAYDYNPVHTAEWLERDRAIMDELGVSKENREKMYYGNLMRFLGIDKTPRKIYCPLPDQPSRWTCENPEVYSIIEKFYKKLGFSKDFDNEFYRALRNIKISDAISIDTYDYQCEDGKRNLLSYLFMCENLKKKYEEKNIPEDIFYDTVEDLVTWTNTWSDIKDGLYLGELGWLSNHLKMKLFRLGRLQFCMGVNKHDIPEEELKKGDNIIEVHIPEGAPLTYEECEKSFERAKEFFSEFYPDFDYKCFTCHSWLMDDTLDELLSENSNMIKFKNMFRRYHREENFAILRYVFKWNTKKSNVRHAVVSSSFAEKVKKHTLSGKSFYCAYGVRSK